MKIKEESGLVFFEIGDNGSGWPVDFIVEDAESLGLQLVKTLVEQLERALTIDRSEGALFKIDFPVETETLNKNKASLLS